MEKIVKDFLKYIGENPQDKRLTETPKRVKNAVNEIFKGYKEDSLSYLDKQFKNPNEININKENYIKEKKIPFFSVCEHHLVPFFGKVSIKYIPNKKIVGLSKLTRTVQSFAAKLQLQERLNYEIAQAIKYKLKPKKVIVKIKAYHLCVSMRGVKGVKTKTKTKVTM